MQRWMRLSSISASSISMSSSSSTLSLPAAMNQCATEMPAPP
jgi:hypothetical protein